MSFDWNTYFALAEELNTSSITGVEPLEHKLRSAVSRSYYALFNLFKIKLESDRFFFPKKDPHVFLTDTLKGHYGQKGGKIAGSIERFRKDRNDADYDANAEYKQDWVNTKITLMKQTVDRELPKLRANE